MLPKILIIVLLTLVEFSTVRAYTNDFKEKIEINDLEDNNNEEDLNKSSFEYFFVEKIGFLFTNRIFQKKTPILDNLTTTILQPLQLIDSPPPKFFFY